MSEQAKDKHPAKLWTSKLFWHDRSEQTESIQIIDLLHDIRLLLLALCIILYLTR